MEKRGRLTDSDAPTHTHSDVDFDDSGTDEEWQEPEESDLELRPTIRSLSNEDVLCMIDDCVVRLQEVTGLPTDDAWALLTIHKWSIEDCMICYSEDPARALKEALGSKETGNVKMEEERFCSVCYESDSGQLVPCLPCGHLACRECWTGHVTNQVATTSSCRIACFGVGCNQLVPRSRVLSSLSKQDQALFHRHTIESHLRSHKNMTWCPTPCCGAILVAENATISQLGIVKCTECNEHFCFSCGENHLPANCQMVRDFIKRSMLEAGDLTWLIKNTKECPQCACFIEKNGGCNWLKCYKCSYEFCWLCGRSIAHREIDAAGGKHRCNAFKDGEEEQIKERQRKQLTAKAADDRKRFVHYHNRWLAHRESSRVEVKKLATTYAHVDNESEDMRALRKFQALGFTQLCMVREMFWSFYIFAYFNQWEAGTYGREIFEDLQNLLENRTELLSKTMEASVRNDDDARDINAERLELIRMMDAVRSNMTNLIDACKRDLDGC
jgi:ariadne-1